MMKSTVNRELNTFLLLLFVLCVLVTSCSKPAAHENLELLTSTPTDVFSEQGEKIDVIFLSQLSSSGVLVAARHIGLDIDTYLIPLAQRVDHNYRQYRWSVGHHEAGGTMISALPPEEELGWTPWERWYKDDNGLTRKESWVMYPLKNPPSLGVARWYKLDENDLTPRFLHKPGSLEDQLRLARIYEAAKILEFDVDDVLINPLLKKGRDYYQQCRWVVVPHILADDGPVIYILPPMNKSDEWPWESWYTDGKTKLIHHVHFTKENSRTTGSWKEYTGAPQRPPEIFGVVWYWYDDKALAPTMADVKQ
jgi:hypothetical protein